MYTPNDKRYDNMIYRRCGKSGLKLSAVSLGFWKNFGHEGRFDNMEKMVHTAFDLGITHFDLANNYGNPYNGSAEENFGRILDRGMREYRDEMCISTKAGYDMWPGPYGDKNGSRKYLTASLDQSLKRMGLDYVDASRVGCYGGSQGGGLSVACAALVPEIKLCAPTYPYMSDYKRVWEMDLATGAYEGIKYYFRHFDPLHEHEEEIFTKLGYIDIQFLAPRIRAKVLMSTGLMDKTCPASTQFAAYNKMTCEKRMDIYPDYGHEGLKGADDRVFDFLAEL